LRVIEQERVMVTLVASVKKRTALPLVNLYAVATSVPED
jgi:hypothetical protein